MPVLSSMALRPEFPPVNSDAPYGPIDILPEGSFELTMTYPSTPEPISIAKSAPIRKIAWQRTEARPLISFPAEVHSLMYQYPTSDTVNAIRRRMELRRIPYS